jgi:hypothetical protein
LAKSKTGVTVAQATRLLGARRHHRGQLVRHAVLQAPRTDHYRDYPAVLIRLKGEPRGLLADVVTDAWREIGAKRAAKPKRKRKAPS